MRRAYEEADISSYGDMESWQDTPCGYLYSTALPAQETLASALRTAVWTSALDSALPSRPETKKESQPQEFQPESELRSKVQRRRIAVLSLG